MNKSRVRPSWACCAALPVCLMAFALTARAQNESTATPPAPPAPTSDPAKAKDPDPSAKPTPAIPTLDELLGLIPDAHEDDRAGDDALDAPDLDPNRAALDRKLSAEEASEKLVQAIQQMGETADRIDRGRDIGIVTQRLQEEIILKLDVLIKQAEQSGGGSGSQQQQSSSSQSQSGRAPSRQQQDGAEGGEDGASESSGGDGSGVRETGFREGRNALLDAAGAAWGRLPDRIRDTLMQGLSDPHSSQYKSETEAYYRKLAEEGNPQ